MSDYGQARTLNKAELEGLRTIVGDTRHGLRNVCIVDFSFLCGLRAKEIARVKISKIVGADGELVKEFWLDKDDTKGSTGRTVYLSNKGLRKRLKSYLDNRGTDGELLFHNQKGGGFTSQSIQNLLRKLYSDAGLEKCRSHSGRRTFATNLIMKGYDIKSVSVLMGHKSIQMTSKYVQENPVEMANMVASL